MAMDRARFAAGLLERLGDVAVDGLADDPMRNRFEVIAKSLVELLELRPEHLGCKRGRDARHDGGAPLAVIAVRLDLVPPQKSNEQGSGPCVRKGEPELGRAFDFLKLAEPLADSVGRVLGGDALTWGRGPGEQRFNLAQLLDESLFFVGSHEVLRRR